MTQRQAPVLDRLINANVTTTAAGYAEYVFNDREDDPSDGTWQIDGQTVIIGRYDSQDHRVPDDLSLPLVGVVVESGGVSATVRVTAWELVTGSYNVPAAWALTVDGALPAAGATLALRLPLGAGVARTVSRKVWASRRDFTGRDFLDISVDRAVVVALSRWTVRADGLSWREGDTFEDADGVAWTVEGVAQLDRGRFVEVMAKRVG